MFVGIIISIVAAIVVAVADVVITDLSQTGEFKAIPLDVFCPFYL